MYREEDIISIGKYIAYLLRHHPEAGGLHMDGHGWVAIDALIMSVEERTSFHLDRDKLEYLVANDSKGRYAFSPDGDRIRARQGHSIDVDVELEESAPPEFLWHGTVERFAEKINQEGLLPMSRLYVHLSVDQETAHAVGLRRGEPVIYKVASGAMFRDSFTFLVSENEVWLTEHVPPEYLLRIA